jgi:hypothetical protein
MSVCRRMKGPFGLCGAHTLGVLTVALRVLSLKMRYTFNRGERKHRMLVAGATQMEPVRQHPSWQLIPKLVSCQLRQLNWQRQLEVMTTAPDTCICSMLVYGVTDKASLFVHLLYVQAVCAVLLLICKQLLSCCLVLHCDFHKAGRQTLSMTGGSSTELVYL